MEQTLKRNLIQNLIGLKVQLNDIEIELKNSGISNPTDFDWHMNMCIKNGNLTVFDVGDKTIDYNGYPELDVSNL